MTDEVMYAGKDLSHRLANAEPHVVDAGPRGAVVGCELAQERNNVVSVLARQLHVGQYDAAKAIHACHQCRSIAIVGCVEMKDVSS